ncbi:unnamed protein product [Adineta ricciae]|uniref:Uncharacterized protein n=1 Tax=Adineta ricciae TaxID=249248 RepID=A0A815TX29_ADIRI|nr:unnamed protein product [Adineta ricciae]
MPYSKPLSSDCEEQTSSPAPQYTYMGRLVTYERPTLRKSKSLHHRSKKYAYDYDSYSSSDDDDPNKLLGVVKVNNRHVREVYRIPTPPPEIRQVYHRARSPKPKIIERVFVRRPTPEIIENIIQVPPQKTKIIHREKILRPSKPIVRTKYVYLRPEDEQQQQDVFTSSINLQPSVSYTQTMAPTYAYSRKIVNPQPIPATCYSYQYPSY